MIYATLAAAVAELKPNDDRRIYRVSRIAGTPQGERYVFASSPAQAALAVIGEEQVEIVSLREKHNAALEALMQKGGAAK